MREAHEIPWPPPVGEPYRVHDGLGSYTEIVLPGAMDGAQWIPAVPGSAAARGFVVARDEWDQGFAVRRIHKFKTISTV